MTVFDAARAAAIETMARAAYLSEFGADLDSAKPVTRQMFLEMAGTMLSALLAARSSTTCPRCNGTGIEPPELRAPCMGSEREWSCSMQGCEAGTVPGGPLILLAPEQRWIDSDEAVALYRAPETP